MCASYQTKNEAQISATKGARSIVRARKKENRISTRPDLLKLPQYRLLILSPKPTYFLANAVGQESLLLWTTMSIPASVTYSKYISWSRRKNSKTSITRFSQQFELQMFPYKFNLLRFEHSLFGLKKALRSSNLNKNQTNK